MDLSVVIPFHREGPLAHLTLRSLERCVDVARTHGIRSELVAVMDRSDALTRSIVEAGVARIGGICVACEEGDPGGARNVGVAAAGGAFVSSLDGDDYYSANWLSAAIAMLSPEGAADVAHPEYVSMFGVEEAFYRQLSPDERAYDPGMFLTWSPWAVWSMARREVFARHPYRPTRSGATGFGYEDWHWHCETLASGLRHALVPGTAGFYRRKPTGQYASEKASDAVIAPTRHLARDACRGRTA